MKRKHVSPDVYDRLNDKQLLLVKVYYLYPDSKFKKIIKEFGDPDEWEFFNPLQCDDKVCDSMTNYLIDIYQQYELAGE